MTSKAIYIRDEGTTIPAILIRLDPANDGQREVLARGGYSTSAELQADYVLMCRADGGLLTYDPHEQKGWTMKCAHLWCQRHFDRVEDGMHLDVEQFRLSAERNDTSWIDNPVPPLKSAVGA